MKRELPNYFFQNGFNPWYVKNIPKNAKNAAGKMIMVERDVSLNEILIIVRFSNPRAAAIPWKSHLNKKVLFSFLAPIIFLLTFLM